MTALGDPTRRTIFERLGEGERSVGELASDLPVSRPAVSQHLRVLKEAGLVTERREGTRRVYRVEPDAVAALREYFDRFWNEALAAFKAAAEDEGGEGMSSTEMIVRKTVAVSRPPEVAFRVFTEGVAAWWPKESHSIGEDRVETVVFESGVGGRIFERQTDGSEHEWGRVTEWAPPRRLVYTWYPGHGPEAGQVVEVRFTPDGDETRVDLEQRGWEKLADEAEKTRASYDSDSGWTAVLALYVEAVGRAG